MSDESKATEGAEAAADGPMWKSIGGKPQDADAISSQNARESIFGLFNVHAELTDIGNADRFVNVCGDDFRYCTPWKKWLVWDGRRWAPDDTEIVIARAMKFIRVCRNIAKNSDLPKKVADELEGYLYRCESNAKIQAMLTLARAKLAVSPKDLDSDIWLLNVQNGIVDLRTGDLLPHDRGKMQTKICPVEYHPDGYSKLWMDFLSRVVPDPEVVLFLQRSVGYSLTGDTGEDVMFFLHGGGRNGKSRFLGATAYVLGDYSVTARPETFMLQDHAGIPEDIAALDGRRFVQSIETSEGKRLSEGLVKQLTGGDVVAARKLYEGTRNFKPQFKLWLASNSKPIIQGQDVAIWERLLLVPFNVYIPPEERDKDLAEKLCSEPEAEGILAWAVQGCLEWQQHGLLIPDAVKVATQEYKSESDVLGEFFDECCAVHPAEKIPTSALYKAFQAWAKDHGQRTFSSKWLYARLTEKGYSAPEGHGRARIWQGIGLRNAGPQESAEPHAEREASPEDIPF